MDLYQDFLTFKSHLSEWATEAFQSQDDNYWNKFVIIKLKDYERSDAIYFKKSNLNQLDLRAILRVITGNWKELSPDNSPKDLFNWLKEMQSISNKYYHPSTPLVIEDLIRAYDTIWRVSEALEFSQQFIKECKVKRDKNIQTNNNISVDSDIQNSLLSLSDLFEKRFIFRIPDFQRGYSWERKQVEQFWQDTIQLDGDRIHYTGTLTIDGIQLSGENDVRWVDVVWLIQDSPDFRPYHIVDGQQRITTMLVLLLCLSKKLEKNQYDKIFSKYFRIIKNDRSGVLFGYESNNDSNIYFRNRFLGEEELTSKNIYTSRLVSAEAYFDSKLKDKNEDFVESILDKITTKFKFNVNEITSEFNSSILFETMNNRGKPLSKLELLKNRLIYISTRLNETEEIKSELRSQINKAWATTYNYLGKNSYAQLDDDDFLLSHYYMYYKYYNDVKTELIYDSLFQDVESFKEVDDRLIIDRRIEGIFTVSRAISDDISTNITKGTIHKYIQSIEKSIKVWFYIKNPYFEDSPFSNNINMWLDKISRLPYRAFDPCIMAILLENRDEVSTANLLQTMEEFIVKAFFIVNNRTHYKRNYFYGKASELSNQNTDARYFDQFKRFRESLDNMVDELQLSSELIHDISTNKKSPQECFWGWKGLNYVLYEYELELQQSNPYRIGWNRARSQRAIERIYPLAPHEEWNGVFDDFDESQKKILKSSIGNLLLIRSNINAHYQDRGFDFKNRIGEGYINGSYSEIEVSQRTQWTAKEILARSIKILEFINRRWNFGLPDDLYSRKNILGLEFLEDIPSHSFVNF